jgi:RHS repeat-associated protein
LGRLQSRTTPEQGTTTFSYFADDTTQTVTDSRGASTTFAYNNRHLPISITYSVTGDPTGRTATTPNVAFAYDEAGNRTSMTDGQGSASYSYNALSQMTSETRTFTGIGSFTLSYAYNLSGELTSITNPWNAQVGYGYDKTGRATSMSGANYAGVSSYVNNIAYRAFGAAKQVSYSNGRTLSMQYDNRLRATRWDVPGVMGWNYAYNYFNENSGRVTYAQNLYDATLDRSYDYDHVGRLLEAHTGSEARGALVGQGGAQDGPYAHSYRYDQFGNMWYRVGWGGSFGSWLEENPSYTNNQRNGLSYDAAGNLFGNSTVTYDATGQQISYSGGPTQSYDGDRLRVKKIEGGTTIYYLRSTVLSGQVVAELDASGNWTRGYVYAGGQMVAIQQNGVSWVHQDPVTKSQRITNSSGAVTSTVDLDPWGGDTSRSSNAAFQPHRYTTYTRDADGGDDAMMRRYGNYWARFSQPDPYDGSYNLSDPQSFNRYAYTQNDPVNFVDPTGTEMVQCGYDDFGPVYCNNGVSDFLFVIGSRFGGFTGGGGGGGRGGGGGGQQKPLPTPVPQPAPEGSSAGKRLSDCVKNLLAPWFREVDLNAVRTFDSLPFYVRRDALAYTEGDNIFFRNGIDQHSIEGISLIAHEITHVRQEIRYRFSYAARYAKQAAKEVWHGRDPAGRGNYLEKEAYEMEDAFRANLQQWFGSRNPCP